MTKKEAKANKVAYQRALTEGRVVRFDGLMFKVYPTSEAAVQAASAYEGAANVVVWSEDKS